MLTKIKSFLTNKWVLIGSLIAAVVIFSVFFGLLIDLFKKIPADRMPEVQALIVFLILLILIILFIGFIIYLISGKISSSTIINDVKTAAAAAATSTKPAGS